MAEIRPNKAKRKIREGRCAVAVGGAMNAEVADFLGQFDFDALWIDTEHGPLNWEDLANISRACDVWGVTPIARVSNNDNALITRTLDAGATGIAIPHIRNQEEAEQAAKSVKYPPVGTRGMASGRQSYGVAGYHSKANDETLTIAFLEDVEAIDNLDEILTVDNIDVFLVAAGDLSADMGYTGQMMHPEVTKAVDSCVERIVAAGRTPGVAARADGIDRYVEKGARYLLTTWHAWVAQGARDYLSQLAAKGG